MFAAYDIGQLLNLVLVFTIFWSVLLCVGALFRMTENKNTTRFFAIWALACGLSLAGPVRYYLHIVAVPPVIVSLMAVFPFLVGPTYYLYTGFLFGRNDRLKLSMLVHLVLPVLAVVTILVVQEVAEQGSAYGFLRVRLCAQFASIIAYYIACIASIPRERGRSIIDKKAGVPTLRSLVMALTLAYLPGFTGLLIVIAVNPNFPALAVKGLFLYIVAVSCVHYLMIQRYSGLTGGTADGGEPRSVKTRALDSAFAAGLQEKLMQKLEVEKIYLIEDLSLPMLANDLGIKPAQLSQFLNTHLKTNFNSMINSYRIRDAAHMLIADPGITVLAAGYAVGFTSKATFNRSFLECMGTTPSAYRKKHLSNKTS